MDVGVSNRDREYYGHFRTVPTRWSDNDIYGHVNNVVYYSYFDTVINHYLIEAGELDIHSSQVIGVAVETGCRFFSALAFPQDVIAGLNVSRLGRSSVRYEIGLFEQDHDAASAVGHFVHVFVGRGDMIPVAIPAGIRGALEALQPRDRQCT